MAPMRVKSRPLSQIEVAQRSPSPYPQQFDVDPSVPEIDHDDSFRVVIKKLSIFFVHAITLPSTFEQLRTTSAGDRLRVLVDHLSETCNNPCIVNALLALKFHYGSASGDKGLNEARANAAEIVAWRFLTHLSEREAVDFCLYEIPGPDKPASNGEEGRDEENGGGQRAADEMTALLSRDDDWAGTVSSKRSKLFHSISRLTMPQQEEEDEEDDPTAPFTNLNALEIAAIADAKRFLSQNIVQKIITAIWTGDIVFWDRLTVNVVKKPRFYNPNTADPFSRLRVPKYLKSFEILFFITYLAIFYAVLVERNPERISGLEVTLYIWFAAFFYDELSEWIDAGSIFYAADVWNAFDMLLILIGFIFAILRIIGLSNDNDHLIDVSFDVLSLQALFLLPRIFSILSLSPYWGTLIPCLKEMGKDFVKFMVLVIIIYLGFLTTFSLIGRDAFTFTQIVDILTRIFFGSSYVGLDYMKDIDPVFGPPLMLVFITLSSILLLGSLTGMLSNSFSRVISHAREEYLYVYSIYVLEASTSNRRIHFLPPLNLISLVIFRPLRLFVPGENLRAARIVMLKATHWPIVGVIQLYELIRGKIHYTDEYAGFRGPRDTPAMAASKKLSLSQPPVQKRLSSSSHRYSSRPVSASDLVPKLVSSARAGPSAAAAMMGEDTETEPPSDVEVRVVELSSKIDRLTDLVLRLQMQLEQASAK